MFENLVEKIIAAFQEILQEVKDYIAAHPEEAKDKVLDLLYQFDSWLHNFIDEVKNYPVAPPDPQAQGPTSTLKKK